MSIDKLTGDQFAALGPAEHALAIYLYQQHINQLERQLKQPFTDGHLDQMKHEVRVAQSMRKLHTAMLNELLNLPAETDGATTEAAAA
ncbi:hypothetical protein [Hymenobacter pini]|uniref:hypothetical protein n=1 Tax=Hymenobacter pini TaxID=2880879 RepID=UPI001CF188B2|nr:hypothetical protein [Hymenobacter pini]MCA8830561.1 hypothetical protein [Hymenobacter pini]